MVEGAKLQSSEGAKIQNKLKLINVTVAAKEAHARAVAQAVAALESASTTANESDARAVAALAYAIICASSTVARTVVVLLRPQALYDVKSGRRDRRITRMQA
jgi:hypothetical protein